MILAAPKAVGIAFSTAWKVISSNFVISFSGFPNNN